VTPYVKLTLTTIRGRRIPGAGTGSDGEIIPLYTTDAASPEVTHYLVTALDEALALLEEAREVVDPALRGRIDEFKGKV